MSTNVKLLKPTDRDIATLQCFADAAGEIVDGFLKFEERMRTASTDADHELVCGLLIEARAACRISAEAWQTLQDSAQRLAATKAGRVQ